MHRQISSVVIAMLVWITPTPAAQNPSPIADEFPGGNTAGTISPDHTYRLSMDLGIEQWEEGQKTDHRYQTWFLQCTSPSPFENSPFDTWCALERIVIDERLGEAARMVTGHFHQPDDGTLIVTSADWPNGRLDLFLRLADNSTAEVMITLNYWRQIIFLDRFEAVGVGRGLLSDTLSTIDYRVPEYDYVLDVPVIMRGYRTADNRALDGFESSLSDSDNAVWETLAPILSAAVFDESIFREAIPEYEAINQGIRGFTSNEADQLSAEMLQVVTTLIDESALSSDGRSKVTAFYQDVVRTMVTRMLNQLR